MTTSYRIDSLSAFSFLRRVSWVVAAAAAAAAARADTSVIEFANVVLAGHLFRHQPIITSSLKGRSSYMVRYTHGYPFLPLSFFFFYIRYMYKFVSVQHLIRFMIRKRTLNFMASKDLYERSPSRNGEGRGKRRDFVLLLLLQRRCRVILKWDIERFEGLFPSLLHW